MDTNLSKFASEFEENFGNLLLNPKRIDKPTLYTNFFLIYNDKPKQKYSDWDVNCWLKPENVSKETLFKIDKFIRSYAGLSGVGLLLPMADKYKTHTFHHLDSTHVLHYMGLFVNEQISPFFDLTIHGVSRRATREAFPGSADEEFESWIMLTAWRKLRNSELVGNGAEYNQFILDYKDLFYSRDEEDFKNDPTFFLRGAIPKQKYADVIKFLSA